MRQKNATSNTQSTAIRALKILTMLKGHTLTGLSNKQLAEALSEAPSAIALSLNSLESEGYVSQLENGRYAHSVALLQIAEAHRSHVERFQGRINEMNARIHAGAN
jgi:DNA-binding IclR family transcriptional regulator